MNEPTVIVLASGRGDRFRSSGGATHKLHAMLGDKSVLAHTLDAVRASGLRWHLEDGGHAGMGDSIAAAVLATPDAHGWLILPGDLPLVRPDTLQRVARALRTHAVVVPVFHGQRGHPVGFAQSCGPALAALSGERGAVEVVRANHVAELAVTDEGCVTDIDILADLKRAELVLAGRAGAPVSRQG